MKSTHGAGPGMFARPAATIFAFLIVAGSIGRAAGEAAKGNDLRGAVVFVRQCALCHTIEKGGPNRFGPNLFGVITRKAASAPGYAYSDAFKTTAHWTWGAQSIASFVRAPGAMIPGTRMGVFQGIAERDLDDLIAYLAQQK